MAFREVSSLDADTIIAIGKRDKKTGKAYPKSAEGYYLGSRTVENKRGKSAIHFLKTDSGNLGVWGTTDLNRKLGQVTAGSMVRITSTGTKPTPNGDMYTYKVESDPDNSIEVAVATNDLGTVTEYADAAEDTASEDTDGGYETEEATQNSAVLAAERKAKFQDLLKRGKTGNK